MKAITPVRPSPIAGMWYEGNPKALALAVDQYLDRAELPELSGEIVGLIAPHAGHRYSGGVAGYAFATVRGRNYDLVAVLSPMHQAYYEPVLTTAHAAYATPLGEVPVDQQAVADLDAGLRERLNEGLTRVAFDQEHSLEIELPFLQRALAPGFKLLPVMVRAQSPKVARQLGEVLAVLLRDRNALIVASTDLSHFYPQEQANAFDDEMLRRVEAFSPQEVFEAEVEEKGYACGLGALAAALWAGKDLGADSVKILRHATSGDVTGDYSSVVGYGAAVILKNTH
jgi:AmmeMemoRadiSam system protein B